MNNIHNIIDDRHTGPLSDPVFDTSGEGIVPWQFVYRALGVIGIDLGDNERCGCHLQRTEAQLRRLGDDLRLALSRLPILDSLGSSALDGDEYRFAPLDDAVYNPGLEAKDYHWIAPFPGAIQLIVGDNREWGCRLVMSEDLARYFADEIDAALVASASEGMRALLIYLGS